MIAFRKLLASEFVDPIGSVGLLLMRVGIGLSVLIGHSIPKFRQIDSFAEFVALRVSAAGAEALAWVVAVVELVASTLVVVGLATRLALIPLIVIMTYAVSVVHLSDPWNPVGERAFIYLIGFLALLCTGPGRFSVDAAWARAAAIRGGPALESARTVDPANIREM